jgi:sulfur relay (sulfurtransferase) DsrF/TusC family protein
MEMDEFFRQYTKMAELYQQYTETVYVHQKNMEVFGLSQITGTGVV